MGCIDIDSFARSRTRFGEIVGFLDGDRAGALSHADLEDRLDSEGRELLRLLYQDHLDLRAGREQRLGEVLDADGLDRPSVEAGHAQTLTTIFGEVTVTRLAYRRRHQPNLHPVDAALNLPDERHSHGLRRLAASEAARGSFDDAAGAIRSRTGTSVGKRQVEELTARAATDFAAFYSSRPRPPSRSRRSGGPLRRRKGHRHAPRRAAARHRQGGHREHQQARNKAVQGRETQPQTHGRSRCRLHRGPRVSGLNRCTRLRRRHRRTQSGTDSEGSGSPPESSSVVDQFASRMSSSPRAMR